MVKEGMLRWAMATAIMLAGCRNMKSQPSRTLSANMMPAPGVRVGVAIEHLRTIRLIDGDGSPRLLSASPTHGNLLDVDLTISATPLDVPGAPPSHPLTFSHIAGPVTP